VSSLSTHVTKLPEVVHRFVDVDGVRVFYRTAGPVDAPTILLLHGFPSASHQYRRLIDALGGRYRLIAPDHPGSGHTQAPEGYRYTFDSLADTMAGFVERLRLTRFVLYAFDFGGPVGLRLATRHPEWIAGLVVQNANAYTEGLSDLARALIANRPGVPGAAERVAAVMTAPVTRGQYEGGVTDTERIAPDGWSLDQHFLDRHRAAQVALALDYHSNVELYPHWQHYLRTAQPPALIVWGTGDAFFTVDGARAYLRDLPDAQLLLLPTGHFALEEKLAEIAPRVADFVDRTWRQA
jgi:pimeloyl-ACP methyl ester carboxylesterase